MADILARRGEFNRYIWNHSVDPFQTQFDERRPLSTEEISVLAKIANIVRENDEESAAVALRPILNGSSGMFVLLLQLSGLTRNKIIQDLKAAARSGAINCQLPSSYEQLPRTNAWREAGPYLVTRLRKTLGHLPEERSAFERAVNALNQATWPGFIRQERAKRSGHEAEYRLATLFASCNLPFEPIEKAENPMCRDAQIAGISFDLVVPSVGRPQMVVKSTVHTANIGQYGESKDHLEMSEARQLLDGTFESENRPLLFAFIDGVGFESNRAGLDGVLNAADEFCQFRTIWKAVIVASALLRLDLRVVLAGSQIDDFAEFLRRHKAESRIISREHFKLSGDEVEAGDALVVFPK